MAAVQGSKTLILQMNFLNFFFLVAPKGKVPHAVFVNCSHTHNNKQLTNPLIISFAKSVTEPSWDKLTAVEKGSGE